MSMIEYKSSGMANGGRTMVWTVSWSLARPEDNERSPKRISQIYDLVFGIPSFEMRLNDVESDFLRGLLSLV
jgi:hypothetical protein